jgi:hypothetical protein
MKDFLSVTETSRELASEFGLSVSPHELSNLIYRRVLGPDMAHMIGGRRMLSRESLPAVADLIRHRCPAAGRANHPVSPA